jgi:hypothetical protein
MRTCQDASSLLVSTDDARVSVRLGSEEVPPTGAMRYWRIHRRISRPEETSGVCGDSAVVPPGMESSGFQAATRHQSAGLRMRMETRTRRRRGINIHSLRFR